MHISTVRSLDLQYNTVRVTVNSLEIVGQLLKTQSDSAACRLRSRRRHRRIGGSIGLLRGSARWLCHAAQDGVHRLAVALGEDTDRPAGRTRVSAQLR